MDAMHGVLGVAFDAPEPVVVLLVITVLGCIAWLIRQQSTIRDYIREAAGVRETALMEIGGQPVEVKGHKEYVDKTGYYKHCEWNRTEHARIEAGYREAMKEIASLHHSLAREVSEINARSETNESRLIQMDAKLDQIRTQKR
jgi:hypothetical protein